MKSVTEYVQSLSTDPAIRAEQCKQICSEICEGRSYWLHSKDKNKLQNIAHNLAGFLIESGEVNSTWPVTENGKHHYNESINDYLYLLNTEEIKQLMEKNLDLNSMSDNGITNFTFKIGNAENEYVHQLLDFVSTYQTEDQRLKWINKPDSMNLAASGEDVCLVAQTALQLAIAKGYRTKDGSGNITKVSNLQLAEQLLKLGADKAIDYQEPRNGNTALHLAYARKDIEAVILLKSFGAKDDIKNAEGLTPSEMLSMPIDAVQKLMAFHTSPDGHPKTFYLDVDEFKLVEDLLHSKKMSSATNTSQLITDILPKINNLRLKPMNTLITDFQLKVDRFNAQVTTNPELQRVSKEITQLANYLKENWSNKSERTQDDLAALLQSVSFNKQLDNVDRKIARIGQHIPILHELTILIKIIRNIIRAEMKFGQGMLAFFANPRVEKLPELPTTIYLDLSNEESRQDKKLAKENIAKLKELKAGIVELKTAVAEVKTPRIGH